MYDNWTLSLSIICLNPDYVQKDVIRDLVVFQDFYKGSLFIKASSLEKVTNLKMA